MILTARSIRRGAKGVSQSASHQKEMMMRVFVALLLSVGFGVSSAGAATGEPWQHLPHDPREAYVAGVVDAWRRLLSETLNDDVTGSQFWTQLNDCFVTRHPSSRQLIDLIEMHRLAHPELPREDIVSMVISSVEEFCGLQAAKKERTSQKGPR